MYATITNSAPYLGLDGALGKEVLVEEYGNLYYVLGKHLIDVGAKVPSFIPDFKYVFRKYELNNIHD